LQYPAVYPHTFPGHSLLVLYIDIPCLAQLPVTLDLYTCLCLPLGVLLLFSIIETDVISSLSETVVYVHLKSMGCLQLVQIIIRLFPVRPYDRFLVLPYSLVISGPPDVQLLLHPLRDPEDLLSPAS